MAGRTPNYVLTESFSVSRPLRDPITLHSGTFVRPIHADYLPRHITESSEFKYHINNGFVYCYTPKGIYPIPEDTVRQT